MRHRAGGFTQINHPTIFPSSVPGFRLFCRGCPWDYTPEQTDFSSVDAIEIQTAAANIGGGLNPFTRPAISFWESALAMGNHIAAVGASDSHRAGRTQDATQSPVGTPTTMVFARRLSEAGIRQAVKAGHTYVKLLGGSGPDLRLKGTSGRQHGMMGDVLRGGEAAFTASVLNAPAASQPRTLYVIKDGAPVLQFPVTSEATTVSFASSGPGRYRLQLERGPLIEAVSSPIYVEP